MQTMVKEMRERAGMTQKQLADALGVTQQSVYYYEPGDSFEIFTERNEHTVLPAQTQRVERAERAKNAT